MRPYEYSINPYKSPYEGNPEKFLKKFSMIVASSLNGVIGKENKLLWHLPNDLKRFKKLTMNKIIIMGKNTYLSLPNGALPGRLNIILCNDDQKFLEKEEKIETPNTGISKVTSVQEAMNIAHNFEQNPSMPNIETDEIFVIGGGIVYKLFIPYIHRLYMTCVDTTIDGDAYFADMSKYEWTEIEEIEHKKDDKHKYDYSFVILEKPVGK